MDGLPRTARRPYPAGIGDWLEKRGGSTDLPGRESQWTYARYAHRKRHRRRCTATMHKALVCMTHCFECGHLDARISVVRCRFKTQENRFTERVRTNSKAASFQDKTPGNFYKINSIFPAFCQKIRARGRNSGSYGYKIPTKHRRTYLERFFIGRRSSTLRERSWRSRFSSTRTPRPGSSKKETGAAGERRPSRKQAAPQ